MRMSAKKQIRRTDKTAKALDGRLPKDTALESAAALLIERGPAGFNIETIVERTGVARTTIYRHWPTRNDLLAAAVRFIAGENHLPDTGTIRGDLLAFFTRGMETVSDNLGRQFQGISSVLEAAKRDPELLAVGQDLVNASLHSIRSVLDRAKRRGELRNDLTIDAATEVLFGAVYVHCAILGRHTTEAHIAKIVDTILDGIRKPKSVSPKTGHFV